MWCLVEFQNDFHGQYPPQVKESSSCMISTVSKLEEVICVRVYSHGIFNRTKQLLWCNDQANELQLALR